MPALGYGGLQMSRVLPKLKDEYSRLKPPEPKQVPLELKRIHSSDGVVVEGIDNCPIKFAKCCSPLPGDAIIGFCHPRIRRFHSQKRLQECAGKHAPSGKMRSAGCIAYWDTGSKEQYSATLELACMDRANLVSDIALALGDMRVPIYSLVARSAEQGRAQYERYGGELPTPST